MGAFLGALMTLGLGFLWVKLRRKTSLTYSVAIRRPHLVQCLVQSGVFIYWGSAWTPVYEQVPLITAQICFAYGCEAIFSWRRFGHWRFGLGPFPVVLSTNLFLWFIDDFFALQFLMIGLAYWSRDQLCVERGGRRQHLFNPSAFALGLAALALVALQVPEITHGENIARTLGNPEYPYIWIFLMGFVVQAFFRVTLVTMSAALAMVLAGFFYTQIVGTYYYIDTAIPVAVFLGMNLLVTDPATSPKRVSGRIIFGALYGVLVFVSYELLRHVDSVSMITGEPINVSWLDKLLCVPFLNLLARPIDRFVQHISKDDIGPSWLASNRLHIGVWVLSFFAIYPLLTAHNGRDAAFWESACEANLGRACQDKVRVYAHKCDQGLGAACVNQGRMFEDGTYIDKDQQQAFSAYKRGCLLNFPAACISVYRLCDQDPILCTPAEKSAALETACTSGSAQSCKILAQRIVSQKTATVSMGEAIESFGAGCHEGRDSACVGLHEIGVQHLNPQNVNRDPGLAHAIFQSACDASYTDACVNLALMEIRGDGIPKNLFTASARLKKACLSGHRKACSFLRRLEQSPPP